MKVKVLFFGATADAAGKKEADLEFEGPINAEEALYAITAEFPGLSKHKLLFARNEVYVKGDEEIAEGDVIAVFTAVSGG